MTEKNNGGARLVLQRPLTAAIRLCFRILSKARPLPPNPDISEVRPEQIVIFSTAGIGDTLSDTPAIRAVKEKYSKARISVVVHQKRKDILEANPWIDALIPHRKGVFAFFSTLRKIQNLKPGLAIILRANDPDIRPLAYLSGAKIVVGRLKNTVFPFLINCPVRVDNWEDLPGVLQTLEIARAVSAESSDPRMVYKVQEAERRAMEQQILARRPRTQAISNEIRVAVQVHASPRLTFRDWPAESFVTLCRNILREFPVRIFLTGGPEDVRKAKEIENELIRVGLQNRVVNVSGKLSLRQVAALLEQCAIFVTTDTGLMHLGFALNVPTLALLHPYNAHRVGPYGYGNRHRTVLMDSPAYDQDGNLNPLSRLSAETVFDRFRQLYSEAIP